MPIPSGIQGVLGVIFLVFLVILYIYDWNKANKLKSIEIDIEGTTVCIKAGDIFEEDGLKAIAFNEYFDTLVDNKVINEVSLNGIFLKEKLDIEISELDQEINNYSFEDNEILEKNTDRLVGKKQKFKIGTIFVHNNYILTAFSKFDSSNRANLTMPEYLGFLITFWDKVNIVYGQRSVSVPIFGSGITRIKEHRRISDEDLLKIMIWTFRISEMRFKHPAKLTIVIHPEKMDKINLLDIQEAKNGI
ncbi:macro domain-containing protein [Acinetobacter lwoffii]|uniref:macro domain-containing protein n=1 Tax=Acinetobacter lwoffii TaxID=28090 RepID=UPI0021CDA386|nr:macro domain-containing protein [Acinetobacter lwoffii]